MFLRTRVNLLSLFLATMLVVLTTSLAYLAEPWLGVSGLAMLYLLLVLLASIYLPFVSALVIGLFSFLSLNFFFVEPRYSFHVASAQAVIELFSFLAVSVTIVSLTERLKFQTQQALIAQQHAQTARLLAEQLLKLSDQESILSQGAQAVARALSSRVLLVSVSGEHAQCLFDSHSEQLPVLLEPSAARWVIAHQQAIGPQTGNWSTLNFWCIPLQHYEGLSAVMFVYPMNTAVFSGDNLSFLQGLVDQVSLAIGLLVAKQREQQAVRQAERESVQHALLASLSHDFRTPLTAILGAASSLTTQDDGLTKAQKQLLLSTIVDEAAQMVDDAENILSLSRIEALGVAALSRDWQLPEELVGVVLGRCRRRFPYRTIETQVEKDLPLLCIDLGLVMQAVMNLVENAIKFDQSDQAIVLSVVRDTGWMLFSVRDHGSGLALDNAQTWKATFARGNHESAQPGFGLGLAICDAVAQLHGGKLVLDNADGAGLVATLRFPIAELPEEMMSDE